jgi:hypothetical protein
MEDGSDTNPIGEEFPLASRFMRDQAFYWASGKQPSGLRSGGRRFYTESPLRETAF